MSGTAIIIGAGASQGVGGALSRKFASEGCHVIVAGRTEAKVAALSDEVKSAGGSAESFVVDVTSAEDQAALFEHAASKGDISAVLYNAGNNAIIPFEQLDAETFEAFWRVGCLGGFLTAKRAIPASQSQAKLSRTRDAPSLSVSRNVLWASRRPCATTSANAPSGKARIDRCPAAWA